MHGLWSDKLGGWVEERRGGEDEGGGGIGGELRTLVRKSLHPAANASCLSLWRLLAVRATMMTGLLNSSVFIRRSSPSGPPCSPSATKAGALAAWLEKTPMLFSRSNLLISFVASSPFMTGSWMSINTK